MFWFVAILAFFHIAFGEIRESGLNGRIVNGVDTTIYEHPYQVALLSLKDGHICGGVIINKNTILTAAHCLVFYTVDEIRLGSTNNTSGGKVVQIAKQLVHPNYNSDNNVNDVALVKLTEDVPESSTVRYIKLADVAPRTGTPAVVTGWGNTCYLKCPVSPTILQKVELKIVSKDDCASNQYKYNSTVILDTMICAYAVDKDSCNGDSGGPLVAYNKLVGIVSWGEGCAEPDYPGVYVDVAALKSWIVENSV